MNVKKPIVIIIYLLLLCSFTVFSTSKIFFMKGCKVCESLSKIYKKIESIEKIQTKEYNNIIEQYKDLPDRMGGFSELYSNIINRLQKEFDNKNKKLEELKLKQNLILEIKLELQELINKEIEYHETEK